MTCCATKVLRRSSRDSRPKYVKIIGHVLLHVLGSDSVVKILVVGPKLVFSYTIAQSLIPWFAKYI